MEVGAGARATPAAAVGPDHASITPNDVTPKDVTFNDVTFNDVTFNDVALDDVTFNDVALDDVVFAVVDVETSGLSAGRHRLLQVAVVEARADGTIIDRWSTYIRPRFWRFARLGPRRVHGIRRRDLRDAPQLAEAFAGLVTRLEGRVLTAHNLGFDGAFLRAAGVLTGHALPHAGELCTLDLARRLDPENLWSHRLGALCERYGVALVRAHDALADAEATAQVLRHLVLEARATTLGELTQPLDR